VEEAVAVLDVGKTHAKLTLVARDGCLVATRVRSNLTLRDDGGTQFLDAAAIEVWLVASLRELVREARILAIVPVAHGAAAAFVKDDRLLVPVLDYETPVPERIASVYRDLRDPFMRTLSPKLPDGLNLGQQLFWQEENHPAVRSPDTRILLWPQYWAWRLSGIEASEVTSLGCHSDLWFPYEGGSSDLTRTRGWNRRLPPLRRASDVLGNIRKELAQSTGLSPDCKVLCGLHDSNASLVAARGLGDLVGPVFVVVSTGTWFVALQSGRTRPVQLDLERDTLANVDVDGVPTPSARFMGGREYEQIVGDGLGATATIADATQVVAQNIMARPSFISRSGRFPRGGGAVIGNTATHGERAAVASLYLALMTNVCLELIDADGPLLVEGRFAVDPVFVTALASLRSERVVFAWSVGDGIALGAARLFWPDLPIPRPRQVQPLPFGFGKYAENWSREAGS